MTSEIKRIGVGPRMSEAVADNGILWVTGQLGAPGGSVADQTRQALAAVDAILARAGTAGAATLGDAQSRPELLLIQAQLAADFTGIDFFNGFHSHGNSPYANVMSLPKHAGDV